MLELDCILHDRVCWPITKKDGSVVVRAARMIKISKNTEEEVSLGFSISIPNSIVGIPFSDVYNIKESYITNGERVCLTIQNNSDADIVVNKGEIVGSLMFINKETVQFRIGAN